MTLAITLAITWSMNSISRYRAVSAALCGAIWLTGCGHSGVLPAAAKPATPVGVVVVSDGPDRPTLQLHGVIASRDELRLSFKVGGIVARIPVEAGDSVHAGQVLAEIELTEIDAQQSQAQELATKASRDLARGEKLYAEEVLSLEQLQNLRTQAKIGAAQLRSAQFNRQYARIVAPADGVLLYRLSAAHELVAAGQPVLVVSAGRRGFILRAAVADRNLLTLGVGLRATIQLDAAPDSVLTGTITELSRAADPATGLFPIEVTLAPTPLKLASGMVARARIQPGDGARLIRIPAGALVTAEGLQGTVFVLEAGHAHRRAVTVAFIDGEQIALRTGLNSGESLITEGAAFLDDGEVVVVGSGS